ncbi:MAG: 2,3-diaminopropionate biosynthesis protein SbnB [Pseudomonadota bacterium]
MATAPDFHVISGETVFNVIEANKQKIFEAVEAAYRLHAAEDSVNPDSYFLRYPEKPRNRIIALPAHLGGAVQKSGIKWISSFPGNTAANLARASAVQILNDAETGYPVACMEASVISATRTAASAALAAEYMSPTPFEGTLCVVGTGIIARTTLEWLMFRGWKFSEIQLFDLSADEAGHLSRWLEEKYGVTVRISDSLENAIQASSLVLFTTTALEPYLNDASVFSHNPTVLHVSLRDVGVDVILSAQNILDDVEHCLKANTSPHLTEMKTGNRDFISGVLVDIMEKKVSVDAGRPRVFSPFGLGVLDIAVSNLVLEQAIASKAAVPVPNFFFNASRW